MSMVAPQQRIASTFVVCCGRYGEVTRAAQERGVCRQWLYREAKAVLATLQGEAHREEIKRWRQRVQDLEQQLAQTQQRQAQTVLLDEDKLQEFACTGQALGVSLGDVHTLLDVLLPGQAPSRATLGRWTQAAGRRAGALLEVLDQQTRPLVRQALADEIYVSQPVLMVVEPESLCWVAGRRLDEPVTGAAWQQQFGLLPALELVVRDGGQCLGRGLADHNRQRQAQALPTVADQLDHFHLLREGGQRIGGAERAARAAFRRWELAQNELARRERRGQRRNDCLSHVRACLVKAERAMDRWMALERLWQQVKAAVQPFTPTGELNTRQRAQALLAELLPQLPDAEFASAKRQLQRPEALTYLEAMQRQLSALAIAPELKDAALCQEGLRRCPPSLQGQSCSAALLRGLLLACTLVLAKAGEMGQQAVEAVPKALRRCWRASSLVECVNSVLRMQQARHRKISQGLLDLKRLAWNCHVFRTGVRRGQSPYQRLGVPWPEGLRWWDVLKWSPEQLRNKLSTCKAAA
jgi:hypothetical protein